VIAYSERELMFTFAKNGDAAKKRSTYELHGVSPEAESLWWERFLNEVGFEPGLKE